MDQLAQQVVGRVSNVEAAKYCAAHQARRMNRSTIRLTGRMELHECRTRISGGGLRAAIGRSQVYTTETIGAGGLPVYEFKPIYPEDRPYFQKAVTDNLVQRG